MANQPEFRVIGPELDGDLRGALRAVLAQVELVKIGVSYSEDQTARQLVDQLCENVGHIVDGLLERDQERLDQYTNDQMIRRHFGDFIKRDGDG